MAPAMSAPHGPSKTFGSLRPWPYTGWPPPSRSTLDPKSSEESSAPRRGLAGAATEQLAGSAVGSVALASASPPSRHGCRAPQAPSTGHGSTSSGRWGDRGGPDVRMPAAPCRPVRLLGPASTRPVDGVQGTVSSVRPRDVHATGVQCPDVDVQRPASVSTRPASAVSAPGDFVERVRAAGSDTARSGLSLAARP
jgi:hypothetical protein